MKLVVNASEFLPSAILNLPLAEAIKVPGIHEVMRASGREAVRTALALGHSLVPILGSKRVEANDPDHYANALLDMVLSGWTRPNTLVTVLQDWMKGRRAEVDDINGLSSRSRKGSQDSIPGGGQGNRQAVLRALPAAALRAGRVREVALRTGAPIVPVAVVGAEEIYPKLGRRQALARRSAHPSCRSRRPSRGSARLA